MFTSLAIGLSGLLASDLRLDAAASNIANMDTVGPVPPVKPTTKGSPSPLYQPVVVDQTAVAGGGTNATVRNTIPSHVPAYDPQSRFADAHGIVAAPNVDPMREMMNITLAMRSAELNAQVISATSAMVKRLYERKD